MQEKIITCPDCSGTGMWPLGGPLGFVPCQTCDGKGKLIIEIEDEDEK